MENIKTTEAGNDKNTTVTVSHAKQKANKKVAAPEKLAQTIAKAQAEIKATVKAKAQPITKASAKTKPAPSSENLVPAPSNLMMVPLEAIAAANQVRTEFNDETINELSLDIASRGVLQPILLRSEPDSAFRYLIIAGERRYRAAKLAGLSHIPAIIGEASPEIAEDMQLAENIQREDLSLKDLATAVRKIYNKTNSVTETAAKLKKSKSWVSKHVAASCPDLSYMAKRLLEDGHCEDLEIVLMVDKLQQLDWHACRVVCDQVQAGDAGRQAVKVAYEAAKAAEEKRQEQIKANRAKESLASDPIAMAQQQKDWEDQKREQAEQQAKDPEYLCRVVMENCESEPDDQIEITPEQMVILADHLRTFYDEARTMSSNDKLRRVISMLLDLTCRANCCVFEIAAYIYGALNSDFNLKAMIDDFSAITERTNC